MGWGGIPSTLRLYLADMLSKIVLALNRSCLNFLLIQSFLKIKIIFLMIVFAQNRHQNIDNFT